MKDLVRALRGRFLAVAVLASLLGCRNKTAEESATAVVTAADPMIPTPACVAPGATQPGIYIPQRGLGIRIEDEILITERGPELLTAAIPKDAEEIERLMAAARR